MNHIKWSLLLVLALASCKTEPSSDNSTSELPPAIITDLPFKKIPIDDLKSFKTSGENWKVVGRVSANYQEEQNMNPEPGTGILFNSTSKNTGAHIFTNWEHGDLELEYEAMLPKGSNSGIYFQGRYEIQLFDSWGVAQPEHSDLGGIYQRWKDDAPEGQQGYEGYAPKINAAKAPGLWQKFYVKFTAPRFDKSGNKIANARFDKVVLNGQTIHQNVELYGPTRAAAFNTEVAKAPIMIQGDHGKVALRNIKYKRFFDQKIQAKGDINYKYYEIGKATALPDFSKLTPKKEGQIDSFILDKVAEQEDYIAIQYEVTFETPVEGDYIFHTRSDDGSKLFINDQLVVSNDFNHGDERRSGLIHLTKGSHDMKVDYFNNTWGRTLRILYEGPEMAYQPFLSLPLRKRSNNSEPMVLNPETEPEMLRSFVNYKNEKRTHAISVGDPKGVHYSLDLNQGALLKAWRGAFLDVSEMWKGRGEPQLAKPLTLATELSDGVILAQLNNAQANYPSSIPDNFKFKEYDINELGYPTFSYRLGNAAIKDQYKSSADQKTLERTLMFETNGVSNLYSRIAHADYIQKLDNGFYSIGGEYYIKILSSELPTVRRNGAQEEMVFQISKDQTIRYSILW